MPVGSSPRLRGTLLPVDREKERLRFIPAPAGNTISAPWGGPKLSVHPRACGEHFDIQAPGLRSGGSSPRLRGTRVEMLHPGSTARFIPAPAGNTSTTASIWTRTTVHPRACGEHSEVMAPFRFEIGSSPRLRGTLKVLAVMERRGRFIPAPAGNTTPTSPA